MITTLGMPPLVSRNTQSGWMRPVGRPAWSSSGVMT